MTFIDKESMSVLREIVKDEVHGELMNLDTKKKILYVIEVKLTNGNIHQVDVIGDVICKKLSTKQIELDDKAFIVAHHGIAINPDVIASWRFVSKGGSNENNDKD